MYGKLSLIFLAIAYFIPPIIFIFRTKTSFYILKIMFKLGYKRINSFTLTEKNGVKIFIFIGMLTSISALIAVILGHYSIALSEDNGIGIYFILGLGYIYFFLTIIAIYLIKNFSMSGYR